MTRKKTATKPKAEAFIACTLKQLPEDQWLLAAQTAAEVNPTNAPALERMSLMVSAAVPDERAAIAILSTKYWGTGGVKLGVAFMDGPPADLRARLLSHFNAWGAGANIVFQEASAGLAQVRVARTRGEGYWSYLGTDVLQIPRGQPTMNLDSFTMSTSEAEFRRVVRHEVGHTLGCPHEHLRAAVIRRLHRARTIAYFRQQHGWSEAMTVSNVLTPLEEAWIIATPQADETSIMTYQLPGSITTDGRPVVGGNDINALDAEFMAQRYPPVTPPPPPPPPPPAGGVITIDPARKTFSVPPDWTRV